MTRKRACFASSVVCTDDFFDLPFEAQALYTQLSFEADADGAIDGVRGVVRKVGAPIEALETLMREGYLLEVDGVTFIRHWLVNNRTDNRNYRPGGHEGELAKLFVSDKKAYELRECTLDGIQSDISLTSDANVMQSNVNQSNANEPNSSEEKENLTARCPHCGFEALASVNEIGQLVIDCHNCGEMSTANPLTTQ